MGVKFAQLCSCERGGCHGRALRPTVNVIYGNDRANVIYATPGPD